MQRAIDSNEIIAIESSMGHELDARLIDMKSIVLRIRSGLSTGKRSQKTYQTQRKLYSEGFYSFSLTILQLSLTV